MLAMFISVALVPWLILNLAFIFAGRADSGRRLINIGLWIGVYVVILIAHDFQATHERRRANAALETLQAYHARTGRWPASLEEANIESHSLGGPRLRYYRYNSESIEFSYKDSLDTSITGWNFYDYDFKKKEWRYVWD